MDGLKSDSETELTSTMGNALSVTNKDEKNDTNDATPTSSTDASTASTASRIVSDDPISSTSSDTIEQTKASEMNQSVTDLLENIPSERITEDVEDLVHDLESLLGESTDSFSIPIRTPPEDVVSQTSGELNVDQEEQPAVSCDGETLSEDTTVTLDTSSLCNVSTEVSEELGLSGSSTKVETDISSSEACVENVEKCEDTNVDVPPQTTRDTNFSLEKEIQPAQDTQEIEVQEGNIEYPETEPLSKICDETERPTVEIVSDSVDTTDSAYIKWKEDVDEAGEHVADKGDGAIEQSSELTLGAEGEEDLSIQTCTKQNDNLAEIKSTSEEEESAAAVDEGIAEQNIISTPEVETVDDLDQDLESKIVGETATEDAGTSEVDNTRELNEKEMIEDSNSLECVQKITENSELSTEIPESTCFVEEPQKALEVTQVIEEKAVEASPEQDIKYLEDSSQPESPEKNEEKKEEGVISATKLPVPEKPVATVSQIQNVMMSENPEEVPEISEATMSGCTETSGIEETGSEAVPNEEIEPMTQEISSKIKPPSEVVLKPRKDTNDCPSEDTIGTIDDIETVSTLSTLPETIVLSSSQTPECSVDITTSIAVECEDECENMDSECAAPSSFSEIIASETTHNKNRKKAPVVVEEGLNETMKEVGPEAEYNEVEHTKDSENQPSSCTEQESEETDEVANDERSQEVPDNGENIPEKTESNDMKECGNKPLEGIITNRARGEDCSEHKTEENCTEQVIVEESQTSESDDYKGEKYLNESEIDCKETDIPPTQADTAKSDIPQHNTTEAQPNEEHIQVEEYFDKDTTAEETIATVELNDQDHESDLPKTELISDESNQKATSVLSNEEDREVDEESATCHDTFNNTDRLEAETRVDDLKIKTHDLPLDKPAIQEVGCSQADVTIIEKPEMDLKGAESSGISEELEKEEKLNDNEEQVDHTSIEESTTLPIEKESTLKVNDISFIGGNEEETKDSEVEKKVEIVSTEPLLSEVNEEILTQPDSTQTIEKNVDTDEKTTVESLQEVVGNDIEDSESSEDSVDTQKNDSVQATLETISDDESSPAESDKTTEVFIDSFEKDPNITKGESKPPVIEQLEFAPLVLSEEDSEEEAVPTPTERKKEENIAPHENIEENDEESEELPQIEEILENQPVYIESTASSVDMQANLETILAVASLQKIDIPKVTEPELLLSEKERREMEALRRAVESITDNSADAYVEEVEEIINIPMLESNVISEQSVFMEAETESGSILKSEDESIALHKEDEIVPDEGSNLISNTDQIELVDSSVTGYEIAENVQKIDETESETYGKNDIGQKKQNIETLVNDEINFSQDIEQSNVDLNTSTSMEIETAAEVNRGHDIHKSNVPTEEKEVQIRDDAEDIIGPKEDDLKADNIALKVDTSETDQNVDKSNDAQTSHKVDKKGITTASEISESQERKAKQKVYEEKGIELVPEVVESQEKETTMDGKEVIETLPEVGELEVSHITQTLGKQEIRETVLEVEQSKKRGTTQTVDEIEGTETISEVGESQERETTQTMNEIEGTETVLGVEESQKREATQPIDELEGTKTISEVGESQEREATQTVDVMEGTITIPEATETIDEKEATKIEVGEMPKIDTTDTVDEREGTKTVPEVRDSQDRATEAMDEKLVTELERREATQTGDDKQDTKTVPEVQERGASETMDKKASFESALDKLQEREATQTIDEKHSTKHVSGVEELQEREATQTTNVKESTAAVPKESQEKEAIKLISKKEDTELILEVGESQEREATRIMDERKSAELHPEVVESREVTQEVNKEKSTVTESDVEKSRDGEASQKLDESENTAVGPEATQKVDQEESASTHPINEESQEKEAFHEAHGEDNETDPDIEDSREREATQKVDEKMPQRRTGLRNSLPEQETLIDSSQVITENEATAAPSREKEVKAKASERPKRHKKSDNKLEELSINVDVPDREKPYSPKITIKPIKVPDEEVSTTSNSEAEVTKGSLKMTITKQSDKLHSVLKVCDSENPESTTDVEEPIPKLIIKPKVQQTEQQHSPKMSTRSSNQRSLSPRITIKPVVKPEKQEVISPLKIKIGLKSEETPKKHSSKASARSTSKQEEDSPRKGIKPVIKTVEENEPIVSPRITIKPIPKPEAEKELVPRLNIKSVRKQDEENDEKERSSPKIIIKPVVKPQEIDAHVEEGEEVKERIVLKINKVNLPTPTKDSKKREHPPDDEKSEKLAKITVKFSKGGGHPHIVQQMEEVHKRTHEEPIVPEKNKKQKVDAESTMSTRSRHKEVAVEALVETKSRHKEHAEGIDFKSKAKDIENPQFEMTRSSKHKDHLQESPIEAKRIKLKESVSDSPVRQSRRSSSRSRQKDIENAEDVQIVEPKLNSPIVISEDSRSQDSGSVILVDDSKEELSLNLTAHGLESPKGTPKSDSAVSTPSTTPTPKKRGRPRKVPIEVREEFKDQEEPPVKTKPKQQDEKEPALPQLAQESGRPKRSCRGPSVCDRLGIKPRKPRGPGRGRGGKRGMGTRPVPMKPEKVPKLTKAKLKLMQKAAKDEAEARKAFGKNPQDSAQVAESSDDVIILEAEQTQETRQKCISKVDTVELEEKTASTSETQNKSDISEPEDSKASETKKKIKSKVFKKLALQKAVVKQCTAVEKDTAIVKKNPHTIENNPEKSAEVLKKLPNLAKSLIETEHKQGGSTDTYIVTEETLSATKIEHSPPVIQGGSVVESLNTVPTDESAPVNVQTDEKDERVSLKEVSLVGEQVSLELKKELLAPEDISLEVKTELISADETPDCVDVPLTAEENSISLEEVSFKLEDKDIDIDAKSIELCKDAVDAGVDVEDEIPYSILAPPGSASSKVFPGLAHGMPASVQPLLATSQKSSNPEHSSVTSTSGPSEIVMVDEETRMSADTSSRAQTPAKQMVAPADMSIEESQSSVHSTATTESGKTPSSRPSKAPRLEVQEADTNIVTAELISEYYWNGNGPFMLQEQVAQFLGIKSFKRKYPGIARRMVEMQERDFIREKGLASENMCDLGLTVVNSADILDIMYSDFQEKYEEYCKHQRDRQAKEMIDKQRAMNLAASQEKNKADITEQAVQSAAQWNARFNKTRKDQRRTCMDLQTLTVHYPKGRIKQINKVTTGNYPVALVPGQFTDFYEEFTPTEINNLPLNTMCYEPVTFIPREESEDSGSDGSESDSDSSDSSSSGSNSDSSSGVEDCKLCTKHSPKRAVTPK